MVWMGNILRVCVFGQRVVESRPECGGDDQIGRDVSRHRRGWEKRIRMSPPEERSAQSSADGEPREEQR